MGIRQIRYCDHHEGSTSADYTATVQFEVKGTKYATDLCDKHLDDFDKAFTPWIKHAIRVGGKVAHARPKAAVSVSNATTDERAAIRIWAAQEGVYVHPRGKIAQAVVDSYHNRGTEAVKTPVASPFA